MSVANKPIPTQLGRDLSRSERERQNPEIEALVWDVIGKIADKWTMLAIEVLEENGRLRFTRLSNLMDGVSQKMLTKTLRQMEADGLLTRTVYPVVPPRVEYELTERGRSLSAALCGVWQWAEANYEAISQSRKVFRQ